MKIRKAVFPVAGLGTRVLPATKAMPKEMLTIVDRPLIQYVVDEASEAGIEHFIFVTGRNKGVIEDHFDRMYELDATLQARGKKAERRLLPGKTHGACFGLVARQNLHLGLLPARLERGVKFVHPVEMILDHTLVAAGDEDEMFDAGFAGLIDHILDQRPVDDGKHFLRHRLGGRQNAGAEAGDREDGFADFHGGVGWP